MKKIAILLLSSALTLALVQCSKRKNPVDAQVPHGLTYQLAFSSQSIQGDIMQDPPARDVFVYTPPGYDENDSSTTYPVLYLLHGYGGTQNYFQALFSLQQLMDEMIYDGEIEPMIVVTPNATNALGGSFYTNSYIPNDSSQSFGGLMQDFITEEVVPIVDSVFRTADDRAHRAIGGHSMGGYGAVKLAMLRNDLFSSASSMSGPLAFWGDYNPGDPGSATFLGILELLPYVFAENQFTPGDTAAFYAIAPDPSKRLTNMMFAMAIAFSPHDPNNPDTTYAHLFSTPGTGFVGRVDLPFGADGQVALPIWSLWMAHDVTALYSAGFSGVFDSTALYVDAGEDDDIGMQGQAQVFIAVAGASIDEYHIYSGFDNIYHADHTTYIGERLRYVIKFHSDSFGQ